MADLKLELERIGSRVRERFEAEKRVLSFSEYLDEFAAHPFRHTRDAARFHPPYGRVVAMDSH
mgnify:CR=1 FL=1